MLREAAREREGCHAGSMASPGPGAASGAAELIFARVKEISPPPGGLATAAGGPGAVTRRDRERLLAQRGLVVWMTGLSGSGKSTLARGVERLLFEQKRLVRRIDGDEVRDGLNAGLGFSIEDRRENVRRIAEAARLFADTGVVVLVSAISPTIAIREMARRVVGEGDFFEVHVRCPLEVCEARDPKGLYRRARAGEIPGFTGIDSPWEPPSSSALEVRTDLLDEAAAASRIVDAVAARSRLDGEGA